MTELPANNRAAMALAALGVVFGDIGTSPLYAFRECFASHGMPAGQWSADPAAFTGAASLIVWSLFLIVSVKYLFLILRLDNKGEGGILALATLVRSRTQAPDEAGGVTRSPGTPLVLLLGLAGATLIYADGTLTPAISVLSAVEGFAVSVPMLEPWGVPMAVLILIGIFALQRRGSAHVGSLFGPFLLLWFGVLGLLGLRMIVSQPEVLLALSPVEGVSFLVREWRHAMPLLAAVFLAVTGGEALYADLGHFGRSPIRIGWFYVVLPGLVLNYLGQAALLTRFPGAIASPFFLLAPEALRLPLTFLATAAAIIASQALISGAFSLTAQAVQLGVLPRLRICHTSDQAIGQVYVPVVNLLLAVACIVLVLGFRTSAALAGAYGVAIALTMAITSLLFLIAARVVWKWPLWKAALLAAPFLVVDLAFLVANFSKLLHGGWFPIALAAILFSLMLIWIRGRRLLWRQIRKTALPVAALLADLPGIHRVKGTAIYMTGGRDMVPAALLHNLKHNQVLHEQIFFLHVVTLDHPRAAAGEQLEHEELGDGLHRLILRVGFAEEPNVPLLLKKHLPGRFRFRPNHASFFLGRESLVLRRRATWLERLRLGIFALLSRNASPATAYFKLPPNRVVELGAQLRAC